MSIEAFLDVLDKAHHGPICSLIDWDTKVIPKTAVQKTKEHGLLGTFQRERPINTDHGLADEFFKAGFELAAEVGMLCVDTERVIKFSENELKDALRRAPSQVNVGEGRDEFTIVHRAPEDPKEPCFCAPLGIAISEDIWVPLMRGIAQLDEVDMLQGGSLPTVYGRTLISKTPYETLAGKFNADLHRKALQLAGRPGMAATVVISSVTEYGNLGGYGIAGGFKPSEIALALSPAELKTVYATLHKVAHALNCGGRILGATPSFIGGYAGLPESTAVVMVAAGILQFPVHQSSFATDGVMDVRYNANTNPESIWAISACQQALARNTHMVTQTVPNQVGGPCTEMLLYETAVVMMDMAVSGVSMSIGPRSAGGRYTDYLTPLETKFSGEVLKRCASMKRTDANEIAKTIIQKYEADLRNPPKGKSFRECYDIPTLQPSKEWKAIYDKVKKEVIDLGMPLA